VRRRSFIRGTAGGLAAAAGGGLFLKRGDLIPPDHSGILGIGETLTFAAHRLLLRQSLAREFRRDQISTNCPAINTVLPEDPYYREDIRHGFREWTLPVEGLVARPHEFTLAEMKKLPSRTQITQHVCEQGWSAIAEWTGVQLSTVLEAVGMLPQAKYVVVYTVDDWWDSLDLPDALHPQTLLAYGMNGGELPVPHGAPIRLRVERQLGYKSLKFVTTIRVTDSLKDIGKGQGAVGVDLGYSWYAGI